jgi:UDP-N-acetylmuramate: L-alanyl-gamma-D-glutamyl-meso-diaminopimelate ligase
MLKKIHIHFTGICGVATSALAIALHRHGYLVTGSDKGFFPPVSTRLTEAAIAYYAGWHPEKMILPTPPELVIAGGAGTSLSNPEIVFAKEHGIPVLSFAEALGKFVIKKNSIVTVGTWGKTTTSALLSFILLKAGKQPSYFTGGLSRSHESGALSDSDWSVVEGDEYQAAIWDKRPKFAFYPPTHLLLTSVVWDHADLYPTEAAYFQTFRDLVEKIPASGTIVACMDNPGVVATTQNLNHPILWYGKQNTADYYVHSESFTEQGLAFTITHRGTDYAINSPLIGRFNTENICGAFAMAHTIGIDPTTIIQAIAQFEGIKRRLERRGTVDGVAIFDDIAHSPSKAQSALATLRSITKGNIIAVFEPNIGNRTRESAPSYDHAFRKADIVVIPRLSKLKTQPGETTPPFEGAELASIIGLTHPETHYLDNDQELITFLKNETAPGDTIVFMGSHGFRGMIEEILAKK